MRSMFLAVAFALSSPGLLAAEGKEVDVAVVANDASGSADGAVASAAIEAAIEAVRGAVVVAARERDVRVIDLLGQGLGREWRACQNAVAAIERWYMSATSASRVIGHSRRWVRNTSTEYAPTSSCPAIVSQPPYTRVAVKPARMARRMTGVMAELT